MDAHEAARLHAKDCPACRAGRACVPLMEQSAEPLFEVSDPGRYPWRKTA